MSVCNWAMQVELSMGTSNAGVACAHLNRPIGGDFGQFGVNERIGEHAQNDHVQAVEMPEAAHPVVIR
jgi:hypothetical protein